MPVYKVNVRADFYIEADTIQVAKLLLDMAINNLPNATCNIKSTKAKATDFKNRSTIK